MTNSSPAIEHPSSRLRSLAVACIAASAIALVDRTPATPEARLQAQGAPLSIDLAYSSRKFLWLEKAAVSPDGAWLAYSVAQPSADSNRDARWQPNGTPSSVAGSRLLVGRMDASGEPRDICPEKGNCWRPAWSPDSRTLAFFSDGDGPPQLWIYRLEQPRATRLSAVTVKPKLWPGDEPIWHPGGKEIFVGLAPQAAGSATPTPAGQPAADKAPRNANELTVTVFRAGAESSGAPDEKKNPPIVDHYLRENNSSVASIDVQTGEARVLVPSDAIPRPAVLRVSPSGRWVSYLSVFKRHEITTQQSYMDLAVVSASGGAVSVLATDLPLQDDYFGLNYSWHPAEDRLVYLKDKKLFLVDLTGDAPSAPKPLAAGLGDLAPSPLWFTRDGRAVVVGGKPLDEKDYGDPRPRALAVVPVDGGEPVQLPIDDRYAYQDVMRANATTLWQPETSSLTALFLEKATGETVVVRMPLDPRPGASGFARPLWKGLGRVEYFAAGGRHDVMVGRFQDIGTPVDLYRFNADFSKRTRLSRIEPRLESAAGATVEIFETTAPLHDGALGQVRTAVILPPGAKKGDKLPAIVLIYPGSDASRGADMFGGGDRITIPTLVFLSRGYAVIYPHLKLGPNREAGNPAREMTDVLLPQVYRAAALGYIDLNRVAVAGQSFGGYGTAAIISSTNLFRGAVAISGIYDLPGVYGEMDESGGSFWIGWNEAGQARMGTHPWANLKRYLDNSPYYQADRIHTPLLILHGDKDMAFRDAEKLFTALRRLGRTVQLAVYHGQGHVISSWTRANAVDAATRAVTFLDRHVRGGAPSQTSSR